MQAIYPLKVQAIRSKGRRPTYYVYFPIPLAAAIGLKAGEQVQWELLTRRELHLVRLKGSVPSVRPQTKNLRTRKRQPTHENKTH